ncbi:MAG: ATP-binding cassette domain-containing protein [Pseudomonadota bacterium]
MVSVLLAVGALAAALLAVPELFGDFTAYQVGLFLIYGIAAQGIGFVWGRAGVLPLGQALFFGVGAYVAAGLLRAEAPVPVQVGVLLATVAALALAAYALAALVFRGRSDSGPYFSLMTLALVLAVEQWAGTATALTGGFNGLAGFDAVGGLDPFSELYYLIAGVSVFVTALFLWLERLPLAVLVRAVADNEPRLQLLGVATHRVKGLAFGVSAAVAMIAGMLFASHQGIVTPTATGFALSAEFVIFAAIGGRFHVLGPVLGAVVVGVATTELRDRIAVTEMAMAVLFILVVIRAPGGLAEGVAWLSRRWAWVSSSVPDVPDPVQPPPRRGDPCPAALQLASVDVEVGSVRILDGAAFETPASGVVCLIGPNGAGKTSVLNTVTGLLSLAQGTIHLGAERVDSQPPYAALAHGIGRKLQVPSVFDSLSVRANCALGAMVGRVRWHDWLRTTPLRWQSPAQAAVLRHPDVPLSGVLDTPAGALPQGHRQFLELAVALAAEPRVVLLDEPCAGLSPAETAVMTQLIRDDQRARNALVVVVEHDMSLVEAIADSVVVLHQGRTLAEGSYDTVRRLPAVQAVYAGARK